MLREPVWAGVAVGLYKSHGLYHLVWEHREKGLIWLILPLSLTILQIKFRRLLDWKGFTRCHKVSLPPVQAFPVGLFDF